MKTTVFTGCSFNVLQWPVFLAASLGNERVISCAGCRGGAYLVYYINKLILKYDIYRIRITLSIRYARKGGRDGLD